MIILIWLILVVIFLAFNYASHAGSAEYDKMTRTQYSKKLLEFNKTEKYIRELKLMGGLVNPKVGETIVDYGCGTGTAARWFNKEYECNTYGYDVEDYWDGERSRYIFDKLIVCDKVYFMHSIAHIEDIGGVIGRLKRNGVKEIHVITPNADWLSLQGDENYKPDTSVVKHYSPHSLVAVFKEHTIIKQGQFGNSLGGGRERLFISVSLRE